MKYTTILNISTDFEKCIIVPLLKDVCKTVLAVPEFGLIPNAYKKYNINRIERLNTLKDR